MTWSSYSFGSRYCTVDPPIYIYIYMFLAVISFQTSVTRGIEPSWLVAAYRPWSWPAACQIAVPLWGCTSDRTALPIGCLVAPRSGQMKRWRCMVIVLLYWIHWTVASSELCVIARTDTLAICLHWYTSVNYQETRRPIYALVLS